MNVVACDSKDSRLSAVCYCFEIIKRFVKVHELTENGEKMEIYSLIKTILESLVRAAVVDPGKKLNNIFSNFFIIYRS